MPWFKHIDRIGLELEGGFHTRDMTTRVYGDGSVCIDCCDSYGLDGDEDDIGECIEGEIQTTPLNSFEALRQFLASNMPAHVNDTCGTHLHISTKTIEEYNTVLCRDFYDSLVEELNSYGEKYKQNVPLEWFERLEGDNTYCRNRYQPREQLYHNRPDERYSFVNYCFRTHNTFEIRVLPAFEDENDLLYAVKYIVRWVNGYIRENLPKSGREFSDVSVMDTFTNPTNIKKKIVLHDGRI
jgi:hypothetical protein